MPLLPASLIEPLWVELAALIGSTDRPEVSPTHPWGCHRRLVEWAKAGHGQTLLQLALAAFDQMIGLDLHDLSVDGSITKSPCGGEVSGRSPVDPEGDVLPVFTTPEQRIAAEQRIRAVHRSGRIARWRGDTGK